MNLALEISTSYLRQVADAEADSWAQRIIYPVSQLKAYKTWPDAESSSLDSFYKFNISIYRDIYQQLDFIET